ncbi:MAG: zinc-ribbon domain-containing protein, partial [Desulfobacterales bacterium]
MIVICEECGKKYRIDPSKIKGDAARFKCRVCMHMIMVSKPSPVSSTAVPADLSDSEPTTDSGLKAPPTDESEIKLDRVASEHAQVQAARKSGPL